MFGNLGPKRDDGDSLIDVDSRARNDLTGYETGRSLGQAQPWTAPESTPGRPGSWLFPERLARSPLMRERHAGAQGRPLLFGVLEALAHPAGEAGSVAGAVLGWLEPFVASRPAGERARLVPRLRDRRLFLGAVVEAAAGAALAGDGFDLTHEPQVARASLDWFAASPGGDAFLVEVASASPASELRPGPWAPLARALGRIELPALLRLSRDGEPPDARTARRAAAALRPWIEAGCPGGSRQAEGLTFLVSGTATTGRVELAGAAATPVSPRALWAKVQEKAAALRWVSEHSGLPLLIAVGTGPDELTAGDFCAFLATPRKRGGGIPIEALRPAVSGVGFVQSFGVEPSLCVVANPHAAIALPGCLASPCFTDRALLGAARKGLKGGRHLRALGMASGNPPALASTGRTPSGPAASTGPPCPGTEHGRGA